MKNLNLSIANPCTENWSDFTPTHHGGFCGACQKQVVDFTKMSDAEIVGYFSKQSDETCGRFKTGQLKVHSAIQNQGAKVLRAGVIVLFVAMIGQPAAAHIFDKHPQVEFAKQIQAKTLPPKIYNVDHVVRGVVKSEDGSYMPGVNIYLKNGKEGTVSDENGKFEFPRKLKKGEVLIFSFLGHEKVEYVVSEELNGPIEITMYFDSGIIMGKVATDEVYSAEQKGLQRAWTKFKSIF